jgi:hypothetical protein
LCLGTVVLLTFCCPFETAENPPDRIIAWSLIHDRVKTSKERFEWREQQKLDATLEAEVAANPALLFGG